MTITAALDPNSADILVAANRPYLWVAAVGVFLVIIIQSVIYYRAVSKVAPSVGMTRSDVTTAMRTGAVASIGPSLAVAVGAITLISVLGTPAGLVRIGLIGSAAYELASVDIVAQTQGTTLGGDGYTQYVFATAFLSMGIAGAGWMVVTLIVTPLLKRGGSRIEKAQSGKLAAAMSVVPTAALIGAFGTFSMQQLAKGTGSVLVFTAAAASMALCLWISHSTGRRWLHEWALGIALVVGLVAGFAATSAGIS